MSKIVFWKDKENGLIDASLYSKTASELSGTLAAECEENKRRLNKRNQIRKFYDEVQRLDMAAKSRGGKWENILPMVHMITAKAAYANGRNLVSDNFLNFIKESVAQVQDPEDLKVFATFFEAFMGFYRKDCKAN